MAQPSRTENDNKIKQESVDQSCVQWV